jgi:hypothetical protein
VAAFRCSQVFDIQGTEFKEPIAASLAGFGGVLGGAKLE